MALVAFALSIIAVANDFTALNVTIPAIEREFDTSLSTAQWVLNAYSLVFAMLIVPGGRLCDMFGAERCFSSGRRSSSSSRASPRSPGRRRC